MDRRNTIQKELVMGAVRSLKNHATAEEVHSFIAKEHPSVGKGTVYRNLSILADDSEIRRVELPDGPDRFDHRTDRHFHVVCVKCGKIFDVDIDDVPDFESMIKDKQGIKFLDYNLVFKGICPDCQNNCEN